MSSLVNQSVVIPTGANGKSPAIDMRAFKLASIVLPTGWTTSDISLYGCDTFDGTFGLIQASALYGFAAAVANEILNIVYTPNIPFLKINSVTSQGGNRTIVVVLEPR